LKDHLDSPEQIDKGLIKGVVSTYHYKGSSCKLYLVFSGKGLSKAREAVSQALEAFPNIKYVFGVGIAGAVQKLAIGDIVVPEKVYNYQGGTDGESLKSRPESFEPSQYLFTKAWQVADSKAWLAKINQKTRAVISKPHVHNGPIASGDKVIISKKSKTATDIDSHYNDTVAVDMESYSTLETINRSSELSKVKCLVIRAISDQIDNKYAQDELGMQEHAIHVAASYFFAVLEKIMDDSGDSPHKGKFGYVITGPKSLIDTVKTFSEGIGLRGHEFPVNKKRRIIWYKNKVDNSESLSREYNISSTDKLIDILFSKSDDQQHKEVKSNNIFIGFKTMNVRGLNNEIIVDKALVISLGGSSIHGLMTLYYNTDSISEVIINSTFASADVLFSDSMKEQVINYIQRAILIEVATSNVYDSEKCSTLMRLSNLLNTIAISINGDNHISMAAIRKINKTELVSGLISLLGCGLLKEKTVALRSIVGNGLSIKWIDNYETGMCNNDDKLSIETTESWICRYIVTPSILHNKKSSEKSLSMKPQGILNKETPSEIKISIFRTSVNWRRISLSNGVQYNISSVRLSVDFPSHTENIHQPVPPRTLTFSSVQSLEYVFTGFIKPEVAINNLSAPSSYFLTQPLFRMKTGKSYRHSTANLFPVLSGTSGHYSIRFNTDPERIEPISVNAAKALEELQGHLERSDKLSLVMQQSDMVLCNNHKLLHFRTSFTPMQNPGKRRWLERMYAR